MNRLMIAAMMVLAFGTGEAMAQSCGVSTSSTLAQVTNLLNNRYACVGASPTAQWNELHSGGQVLDYKMGPGHPTDPSDTPTHPTGTYSVAGLGTPQTTGTVTYVYTTGGTYAYHVGITALGQLRAQPGSFAFCGIGGAPNLTVTVSLAHC